jgi:hypothetical protein
MYWLAAWIAEAQSTPFIKSAKSLTLRWTLTVILVVIDSVSDDDDGDDEEDEVVEGESVALSSHSIPAFGSPVAAVSLTFPIREK